jgi:hypothetical protein
LVPATSSTFVVAPYHPITQGKIERWHQPLKHRILLENYYLPGDLEAPDRGFRCRLQPLPLPREHRQSHPGRYLLRTQQAILAERERIERQTITKRRLQHQLQNA